jgi:6-phosphogluconolactonase
MKNMQPLFRSLAAMLALFALAYAPASPKALASAHYLALAGTYTNQNGSKGIYAFDFDTSTGKLSDMRIAAETRNPSWVAIHPNGKYVYAANESGPQSTVTAYALDASSGRLTQLNQLPSLGEDPCYLSFDRTGKYLFVANYTSGTVAVFPILADGKLGEHTALVNDTGTLGPNTDRQEHSHAHWVQASADNRFVFVSDLGLDAILSFRFDAAKGTLTPNDPPFAKLAPGSGPRHMAFSPNGKFAYVLSELSSTVTAFSYDGSKGVLSQFQIISTRGAQTSGRNDTAEVAVDPSGKWLFASNRGLDTISVFSIDPSKGTLTSAANFPTGGKEPRHFAIDPSGHFLLAENQNTNSIVVFRVDPARGSLTKVSETGDIPSPVCLSFVPQ